MLGVLSLVFITIVATEQPLVFFWNFFNTLQLMIHLPLIALHVPYPISLFLKNILPIAKLSTI